MVYDLRLLSKSTTAVPLQSLQSLMEDVQFEIIDGQGESWTQLLVMSAMGNDICTLELAGRRSMAREVEWLRDDLDSCQPRSAAMWASAYLHSSRAIYGCNLRSFGQSPDYAMVPSALLWGIQSIIGDGILHVEGQGFSNQDGDQITWEFSDRIAGTRQMAVLGSAGRWHAFEMDLADAHSREAFKAGVSPFGAELLTLH